MAAIRVHAHYTSLLAPGPMPYNDRLEALLTEHFGGEPWEWLVRASARHSRQRPDGPPVEPLLRRLDALGLDRLAEEALARLATLLPPPTEAVHCHLLPTLGANMGGCSYAPGKMLMVLGDRDALDRRLLRNVAHEYSHTVRMARWPQDERHGFGPVRPYSVRAYLVFEGLADALADHLYPWDRSDERLPPELEPTYWAAVTPHLDETGSNAYVAYVAGEMPGLPPGAGYAAGARLVKRFLLRAGMDAVAAQHLPWEEIYFNSGYPLAR